MIISTHAHLIAGICSKAIVIVFHFDFDVIGGTLLTPAQALKIKKLQYLFTTFKFASIASIYWSKWITPV